MDDRESVHPDDQCAARTVIPEKPRQQERVDRNVQGRERRAPRLVPQASEEGEDPPLPEAYRVQLVDQQQGEPQ